MSFYQTFKYKFWLHTHTHAYTHLVNVIFDEWNNEWNPDRRTDKTDGTNRKKKRSALSLSTLQVGSMRDKKYPPHLSIKAAAAAISKLEKEVNLFFILWAHAIYIPERSKCWICESDGVFASERFRMRIQIKDFWFCWNFGYIGFHHII